MLIMNKLLAISTLKQLQIINYISKKNTRIKKK